MLARRLLFAAVLLKAVFASAYEADVSNSPVMPFDGTMESDPHFPLKSDDLCRSPLPTWQFGPNATVHIRGRIDTDFIATSQSAANVATFGDLGSVVGLRRARIGAEGKLPFGHYIAEIDLASGNVVLRDLFIGIGDRQAFGEYRGGHFREPFSFEGGTSANSFAFLERSQVNVLDPARNWGLCLFRSTPNESLNIAAGLFQSGSDANDLQGGDGSTAGITERLTFAPINDADGSKLLHLGVALSERIAENGIIVINQQPRSSLLYLGDAADSPFIPMIKIPATYQQLLNLQVAVAKGPVWAQAEWYGSWIVQNNGGSVFLHGSYAACGWFITGEHREYSASNGGMGAVRVNRPFVRVLSAQNQQRGGGAWEVVARFSYLDFQDSNTPLGPSGQLVGLQLPEWTAGVNWYLCDNIRLMFNYIYALPNEPNTGTSAASEYAMRLGVYW